MITEYFCLDLNVSDQKHELILNWFLYYSCDKFTKSLKDTETIYPIYLSINLLIVMTVSKGKWILLLNLDLLLALTFIYCWEFSFVVENEVKT